MHYCAFVIIGNMGDPETLVAEALPPFDENLEVPPYRRYLDRHEVSRMAEHYGIHTRNLHALAKRMNDWRSCEGGVDRHGLYAKTTCNPEGRWDWYDIGGRWAGYIKGSRR